MDVDSDFSQHAEEISTAEEENIEEKPVGQLVLVADDHGALYEADSCSTTEIETEEPEGDLTEDLYQLNLTVAVTETEGEEIENEFNDALTEIEGEKSFPCSKCDKVCKSKGGLTRHTNSKHSEVQPEQMLLVTSFCVDTVASMVESIKTKIVSEKLYGTEINNSIQTASSTQALYDALYPLYETFCRKTNQDKLVESFFALIPQSCELLNCEDYKAANLIMIHLPDNLVGFYYVNRGRTPSQTGETTSQSSQTSNIDFKLDPAERGPLSYVAGYVVSKLYQTSKRKAGKPNEELQSLLQNMKSLDQSSFISARTRGGLVNPSKDLMGILEEAEFSFRKQVSESKLTLRNIPTDMICNATLESPVVKSLWDNIVTSSGVDSSSSTQKLCLENVVKLYLKVRSFSYARDYLTKHKIKQKQVYKKKALRKDLKRSAEKTT